MQGPSQAAFSLFNEIKVGSRVKILVHAGGIGSKAEYKPKTGRAVMKGPYGWVLNMGGKHGTPGIATPENVCEVGNVNVKAN